MFIYSLYNLRQSFCAYTIKERTKYIFIINNKLFVSVLFIIYFFNKYPSDIKYFYRLLVLMLNQLSTILLVKMLQWHDAGQRGEKCL